MKNSKHLILIFLLLAALAALSACGKKTDEAPADEASAEASSKISAADYYVTVNYDRSEEYWFRYDIERAAVLGKAYALSSKGNSDMLNKLLEEEQFSIASEYLNYSFDGQGCGAVVYQYDFGMGSSDNFILFTTDDGDTWEMTAPNALHGTPICAAGRLYMSGYISASGATYISVSEDGGANFTSYYLEDVAPEYFDDGTFYEYIDCYLRIIDVKEAEEKLLTAIVHSLPDNREETIYIREFSLDMRDSEVITADEEAIEAIKYEYHHRWDDDGE